VRLITRNGYDWTKLYPWIAEAALKNRIKQFVIDGEAVILGVDGIPDFNALHSHKYNGEVQLYAFDIMALDGDDLRDLPLSLRKTNLARLLARRPEGISLRPLSKARSVPTCFERPANWGLRDWCRSAGSALSRRSVAALGKGENPASAAMLHAKDAFTR
jgi:bifunctional non-homologous end joining protein LigD